MGVPSFSGSTNLCKYNKVSFIVCMCVSINVKPPPLFGLSTMDAAALFAPPVYPPTPPIPQELRQMRRRNLGLKAPARTRGKMSKVTPRSKARRRAQQQRVKQERILQRQQARAERERNRLEKKAQRELAKQAKQQEKKAQRELAKQARRLASQEKKGDLTFAQEARRQARALNTVGRKKVKKLVSLYEILNALQKAAPNRDKAVTGNTTVGSYLKHFKLLSKRVTKLV